jgi:hypothetical protein
MYAKGLISSSVPEKKNPKGKKTTSGQKKNIPSDDFEERGFAVVREREEA